MELTFSTKPAPSPTWDELTPEEQEKLNGIKNMLGFFGPDGIVSEIELDPIPYENCPIKQMLARAMVNAR